MNMKPLAIYLTVVFLSISLYGCALVPPAPQTPEQTVFATKALHGAVAGTTADLLKAHVIDAETAQDVYEDLQRTQKTIDAAVALVRNGEGIPNDTLARINLIQDLLQEWQDKLLAKQAEAAQ